MTPEQAIEAIRDLISAEVRLMKQMNSGSGRITKKASREEDEAAARLFNALTDKHPTPEQVEQMVNP